MAKIGLNILVSGFTGKLLIRWLEASAPLAEVGRSAAFDFPYDDVYTINDIQPVVHIVQLWQSVNGTALTQLIKQWEIDGTLYNEISSVTYQYRVDRGYNNTTPVATGPEVWADPENLDTVLVDERLDGSTKAELYVVEAGYGPKLDNEYNLQAGGGIILLNGKTFDSEVAWFITHTRIITQQVSNGSTEVPSEITDVQIITANINIYTSPTVNLYNKLCIANGSGTVLTVTFIAFASIPNNTRLIFNTHRGSQKYLTLAFNGSETIYLNGTLRNKIYLAKGEEIKLWFKDGVGYVANYSGNDKIRGQVLGDSQDRSGTSGAYILADESTGVLTGSDYPGLYEWLQALPPGVCATVAGWSSTKQKFALDTLAGTFRVPHLDNMHRRFRTGSVLPGVFEDHNMPQHYHALFGNVDNGGTPYIVNQHATGGNSGYNMAGSSAVPTVGLSGPSGAGTETTVKNYKEIPLIVL